MRDPFDGIFTETADSVKCHILYNVTWCLDAWYKKPAHLSEVKSYPEWHKFLTGILPDWYKRNKKEPIAYYNANWKPFELKHSEISRALDAGNSITPGKFIPNADPSAGKVNKYYRRRNLQENVPGIGLDIDIDIPTHIKTCDDLISEVPFLRYATFIRESLSSRSDRKNGLSQFRAYFGFETPIQTDYYTNKAGIAARLKLGNFLSSQSSFIAQNVSKNSVCVSYGNANSETKYNSNYLISARYIKAIISQCKVEQNRTLQKKSYTPQRANGNNTYKSPINAFISEVDPIDYMINAGWIEHIGSDRYKYYKSESVNSCIINSKGIICPFSDSMIMDTPDREPQPISGHRFIIYKEYGLDITKASDKKEIYKSLANLGYGTYIKYVNERKQSDINNYQNNKYYNYNYLKNSYKERYNERSNP